MAVGDVERGVEQVRVVAVVAGRHLAVEDAVGVRDVAVEQRRAALPPRDRAAVVGLFVLAPADVADETVVVELDALAADAHRQRLAGLQADPGLVDARVLGIGDDGEAGAVGRGAGAGVEVVQADFAHVGELDEEIQAVPLAGAVIQPGAQRRGLGVLGNSVLVNELDAVAEIEADLAAGQCLGNVGRGRWRSAQAEGESGGQRGSSWCGGHIGLCPLRVKKPSHSVSNRSLTCVNRMGKCASNSEK